jgi:tRNA threonylcarbamoyladenosine biosynthesis protein TsaE
MNQLSPILLADEAATLALGAALAECLEPGLVIYLDGDLGAGKTTLVRGVLRALGHTGSVKSPTYTLVELHTVSGLNLYHFDFYRFNQPEEYLDAGLDEYFSTTGAQAGVCLVEWPERAAPYVPACDLRIRLGLRGTGRVALVEAVGARGERCLTKFVAPAAQSCASPPLP